MNKAHLKDNILSLGRKLMKTKIDVASSFDTESPPHTSVHRKPSVGVQRVGRFELHYRQPLLFPIPMAQKVAKDQLGVHLPRSFHRRIVKIVLGGSREPPKELVAGGGKGGRVEDAVDRLEDGGEEEAVETDLS